MVTSVSRNHRCLDRSLLIDMACSSSVGHGRVLAAQCATVSPPSSVPDRGMEHLKNPCRDWRRFLVSAFGCSLVPHEPVDLSLPARPEIATANARPGLLGVGR